MTMISSLARSLLLFLANPTFHMKINLIPTKKLALLCSAVCAAMFAFNHNADALTIGDNQTLGYVFFGIPSGDTDRLNYVNDLVAAYNAGNPSGFTFSGHGQSYTLVNGQPAFGATLPNAVLPAVNGTSTTINLGSGLYSYLFAKYDGPNQGSVVWYVGNLSGTVTIPGDWNGYGLSGWTLFGPGGHGVPDGGTTAMLLGTALGALGMVRRFLKS
jgi:VPDSG-CTERM motif